MREERWEPVLDDPIVPGQSLGGLVIGTRLFDIQKRFYCFTEGGKHRSSELCGSFEVQYTYANGAASACFDARNGKMFKAIAGPGYRGMLFGKVAVGMLARDAFELVPELYYSEEFEEIRCKGHRGISLAISEVDPPPEEVPDLVITHISVHVLDSPGGQAGDW